MVCRLDKLKKKYFICFNFWFITHNDIPHPISSSQDNTLLLWHGTHEFRRTCLGTLYHLGRRFTRLCHLDTESSSATAGTGDINRETWPTHPQPYDRCHRGEACRQLHVHCQQFSRSCRAFYRAHCERCVAHVANDPTSCICLRPL